MKEKIHNFAIKISKFTLPLTILVASVILGGFIYATQVIKQKSIEKQQGITLQENQQKAEQTQKEYIAKRKTDCLDIYKVEGDKWNNVLGWRYSETDDQCLIRYKDSSPKSDAKCDELYPTGGTLSFTIIYDKILCKDGEFENSF